MFQCHEEEIRKKKLNLSFKHMSNICSNICLTLFNVSRAASACRTAGSAFAKSSSHLLCLSATVSFISATFASSSDTV